MDASTFQPETFAIRMARFDVLPPAVRGVMNDAAFEFHPSMAERLLRRGASADRCALRIAPIDRGLTGRKGGA